MYIDETIDCVKYSYEYYIDNLHQMGYIKLYEYFIGEPYNLIISYNSDTTTDKEKMISVTTSDKPRNKYMLGFRERNSNLFHIKISKSWVDSCKKLLNIENSINDLKCKIYDLKPDQTTQIEIFDEMFKLGLTAFGQKNKIKALDYFEKCLSIQNNDNIILYNIACCYSGIDNNKSLNYLKMSIKNGNNDINWIQSDPDLAELRSTKEFKFFLKEIL